MPDWPEEAEQINRSRVRPCCAGVRTSLSRARISSVGIWVPARSAVKCFLRLRCLAGEKATGSVGKMQMRTCQQPSRCRREEKKSTATTVFPQHVVFAD